MPQADTPEVFPAALAGVVAGVDADPMPLGGGRMYYHGTRPAGSTPSMECEVALRAALGDQALECDAGRVALAMLWLARGCLDAAHDRLQGVGTKEASLVHAMVHRREGSAVGEAGCTGFSNAKYWLNRARIPRTSPVAARVCAYAIELAQTPPADPAVAAFADSCRAGWAASGFVDLMIASEGTGGPAEAYCVKVQHFEWRAVLAEVVAAAGGDQQ